MIMKYIFQAVEYKMDSFIFALNAILPIVFLVLIGYVLKRIGLLKLDLAKGIHKLVFRVFLPVMLFLNVYKIETIENIGFGYIIYAIGATLIIFALSIPVICALTPDNSRRGVLLQVTFRSNYALIGIALATELFPDGGIGAAVATLLSAFIIPIFNILAVICLTVFSSSHESPSIKKVLLGIIKNPLIIGVLLGAVMLGAKLVLRSNGISFALEDITPVWKTLNYLSTMATPIALVALGAQFEFSAIAGMKRELIFGVAMRGVIIPALALTAAYLLGTFNGPHFATFVAVFCTPIAVSSVPMAQEMGADTSLAGQLVVWTTIFSAITIFATSFILKELGAFAI